MIYKGKINGCMGFKMGKELKSMSVVIVIPMGFKRNWGYFAGGGMGYGCIGAVGHQFGRRGILGRRVK